MMRRVVVIVAVLALTGFVANLTSAEQAAGKNLKVLTDLPMAQVNTEMQQWTKALGVKCSHCHKLGDFASDEVDKKEIARRMATMVKTINKDFFKGETKATCMTCHRGAAIPTLEGSQ